MSCAPQPLDPMRRDRALDRLFEHCELTGQRTKYIEQRRVAVLARLEHELGTELTVTLLGGLTASSRPAS
jgi:hypothetical protein